MTTAFFKNNHRNSGLLEFLYKVLKPMTSNLTGSDVDMMRVMHVVYTEYYRGNRSRLEDMVLPEGACPDRCILPRDYVPPMSAPAAIHALFADPTAQICQPELEAAMAACTEYASDMLARRLQRSVMLSKAHVNA